MHADGAAALVGRAVETTATVAIVATVDTAELAHFGYSAHSFASRIVSTCVSNSERLNPVQACVTTVLISSQQIALCLGCHESGILLLIVHGVVDADTLLLLASVLLFVLGLDEGHGSVMVIVAQCVSDVHSVLADDAVPTAKFLQNDMPFEDTWQYSGLKYHPSAKHTSVISLSHEAAVKRVPLIRVAVPMS